MKYLGWNYTQEKNEKSQILKQKHNGQNFYPIIWVLNEVNLPYYHEQIDQTS